MSDDPTTSTPDPSDVSSSAGGPPSENVSKPVLGRTGEAESGAVARRSDVSSPEAMKEMSLEDLPLISGSEPSIERFIEQSYTSPASARMASQSLVETFDDKGLWLASLIQPAHLAAELRQQCSILSNLVIMQWVRQGETQKLKVLSETLLAEPPAGRTHESACTMTVLGGLLGILRPSTAQKLINGATPHLSDLEDSGLLHDARQWVEAGRILEQSPPEERVFWNRHLREPGNDWDWNSAEARLALRHLAGMLPREGEILQVFQSAVPGCWWDLWRASPASAGSGLPTLPAPPAAGPKKSRFTLGLVLGMAAATAIGWVALPPLAESINVPGPVSHLASAPAGTESEGAAGGDADAPPAPPIRESLRQLQSILRKTSPVSASAGGPQVQPAASPKVPEAAPASSQTKPELRASTLARFAAEHDDARRLVSLVKSSSYRENATLIQGGNSVAPKGSPAYQGMIHWLILDPPELADVRLAVTKLALHSLPVEDTIRLFDLCYYPGSPNEIEIKQCASLLMELPDTSITGADRVILNKIVSAP